MFPNPCYIALKIKHFMWYLTLSNDIHVHKKSFIAPWLTLRSSLSKVITKLANYMNHLTGIWVKLISTLQCHFHTSSLHGSNADWSRKLHYRSRPQIVFKCHIQAGINTCFNAHLLLIHVGDVSETYLISQHPISKDVQSTFC